MIEKIILKKSAVENKMPTTEQLEYGEIALNFNTMNPFISFRDTADGIRQIKDYSNEIQNINGSLTDAKNEINYLRPLVTDNHTNLMFLRGDFEDFKEDNTKTINVLDRNVSQNGSEIQEVNGIVQNHTDAIATLNTSIAQKADKTDIDTINAKVDKKVSKTDIVQNTGQSTTSVMSQKAVSDALSTKVGKTDITQSTGTSETAVMSQKASTMAFAANTPSGDPMHYMYECVGGIYNDTGSDVVVNDPIVGNLTHKAGCWWCTGLGDLTNDDMRKVYGFGCNIMYNVYSNVKRCYNYSSCRTTCTDSKQRYYEGFIVSDFDISFMFCFSKMEIIKFANSDITFKNIDYAFYECTNLRHIYNVMKLSYCTSFHSPFYSCINLTSVKIYDLTSNIDFKDCRPLNIESIIYMIENATDATITITLHPEAYERAIVDAGVQTALANKTNVSLSKGE